MKRLDNDWACDDIVSMPVESAFARIIPFGGFAFTEGGITLDVSASDLENLKHPPISPYHGGVTR